MRCILLLIALALLPAGRDAYGQIQKNAVELGAGYAVAEAGGAMFYGEYTRRLSVHVQLGLSAAYTESIYRNRPWRYSDIKLGLGDVTVYFLPLARLKSSNFLRSVLRLHTLKLGAGFGIRHLDRYEEGASAVQGQAPDIFWTAKESSWSGGFNGVAEYEVARHKEWFAGLRAALHVYHGGDSVEFVGLNLGRNF
jgi:hypothetical protein